jgi:hypothetical protein
MIAALLGKALPVSQADDALPSTTKNGFRVNDGLEPFSRLTLKFLCLAALTRTFSTG